MKTSTCMMALAVLASLTVVSLSSAVAIANPPQKLLLNLGEPNEPNFPLPKFGFSSVNIAGVGERVTSVKWNGRAAKLGLEPGDIILSVNGYSLSYPGSWKHALYAAMLDGGWVQLSIRDVRTGLVATRETFVGFSGNGPIVQSYSAGYPVASHDDYHHHNHHNHGGIHLKDIVNLIEDLKD